MLMILLPASSTPIAMGSDVPRVVPSSLPRRRYERASARWRPISRRRRRGGPEWVGDRGAEAPGDGRLTCERQLSRRQRFLHTVVAPGMDVAIKETRPGRTAVSSAAIERRRTSAASYSSRYLTDCSVPRSWNRCRYRGALSRVRAYGAAMAFRIQ
jgi:hypothetical protein